MKYKAFAVFMVVIMLLTISSGIYAAENLQIPTVYMNGENSSTGLIQLLKELEEMVHAMCLGQCVSVKS